MRALTVILLFALFGNISIGQTLYKSDKNISVGAKQYESYSKVLKDKRVAVVGNHTSMVDSVHLVDWLLAKDVNIVSVFAPEHGFRGKADAGEKV